MEEKLAESTPEVFMPGEYVSIAEQALLGGLDWVHVRDVFDGTVVGGPDFPEGEDPGPVVNVMPDEPYPPGDRWASLHPRYFLREPFWVEPTVGVKIMCRYIVTRKDRKEPVPSET